MRDKIFISQLKDGMAIDSYFVVVEKELLDFKSKPGRYLQVKFKDKTGEIWGKCWDEAEKAASHFETGDVVNVKGNVTFFKGYPQLEFTHIGITKVGDFDIDYFVEKADVNVDGLYNQLKRFATSFNNKHLKMLLLSFLEDESFEKDFKFLPCAKSHHHNYIGGLIEHTYAVVVICRTITKIYPPLDKELLLASAILHDIGKIKTYSVGALIEMTPEGGLFEHVVMSYDAVKEKISTLDNFPKELEIKLLHAILSHHGKREWGSPQIPMTEEACALHYADLLDSQISEFIKTKKQHEVGGKGIWSSYSRGLERFFYLGADD
ncbi:MAG: 3'-5' exoribonuclease YhaM family protein [Candidatus Methanofastidiosia archaeon]